MAADTKKVQVVGTDLLYGGYARRPGAVLELPADVAEQLIASGQVTDRIDQGVEEAPLLPEKPAEPEAPETEDEGEIEGEGEGVDYSKLKVDELAELAAERGIEVTRTDGQGGNLRKADYVAALEAADQAE